MTLSEFEKKQIEAHKRGFDLDYKEVNGDFIVLAERKIPTIDDLKNKYNRNPKPTENLSTK